MKRLVKGAKENFGWVEIGPEREICIPPSAWQRYGFQIGEELLFMPGSNRSGGFGLTSLRLLEHSSLPVKQERILGRGVFVPPRTVRVPDHIPVHPSDRLLTIFGSGFALGFAARGPIFEEALRHPELEVFKPC